MAHRPRHVAAVAAVGAVSVLTLNACGTNEPASEPASITASEVAESGPAATEIPPPTADELQKQFASIIDPAVPAEQKAVLVEGGQDDPAAFDALAQKLATSPGATMALSEPVTDNGDGTVSMPFTATFDGQKSQGDATFVSEDDQWMLSRENACAALNLLSISSPACPEA
ncbi:MAG: hypothetical protein L0H59_02215 [Tomitella sp.]|nr:hypothetical protein [Tomitella sp.]